MDYGHERMVDPNLEEVKVGFTTDLGLDFKINQYLYNIDISCLYSTYHLLELSLCL